MAESAIGINYWNRINNILSFRKNHRSKRAWRAVFPAHRNQPVSINGENTIDDFVMKIEFNFYHVPGIGRKSSIRKKGIRSNSMNFDISFALMKAIKNSSPSGSSRSQWLVITSPGRCFGEAGGRQVTNFLHFRQIRLISNSCTRWKVKWMRKMKNADFGGTPWKWKCRFPSIWFPLLYLHRLLFCVLASH